MTSGGPAQTAMSTTRAAGRPPMRTVGHPGPVTGPPTCGTRTVTIGQTCMSVSRAAGWGILSLLHACVVDQLGPHEAALRHADAQIHERLLPLPEGRRIRLDGGEEDRARDRLRRQERARRNRRDGWNFRV